jgi:dipeptidyl aminopeptidase/acylaminoacyl peptidase
MPDVQEVFRMATQKVRPDPGAMERQNRTQRRRSVTRRAGGYALLAVLVIAAAVIGVVATRPRDERPAGQKEEHAPTTADLLTKPHFLNIETGETTLLPEVFDDGYSYVPSPDGTMIAYGTNVGGGCGHEDVVKVANVDGTNMQTLTPPEGFVSCAPRWSPDGTKIVYQERADTDDSVGNLVVHDFTTGEKTQITDLQLTRAWWYFLSPRFGVEGGFPNTRQNSVIFHLPRSSSQATTWDVWSVPVTGGEPTLLLRNAAFPIVNGYGPEGERIQFVAPMPDDLAGQSLMTGRPFPDSDIRSTLAEANVSIWWPTRSPDGRRIAYQDGGSIYVVSLFTGESSQVAEGSTAEWLDNDTLIVAP